MADVPNTIVSLFYYSKHCYFYFYKVLEVKAKNNGFFPSRMPDKLLANNMAAQGDHTTLIIQR